MHYQHNSTSSPLTIGQYPVSSNPTRTKTKLGYEYWDLSVVATKSPSPAKYKKLYCRFFIDPIVFEILKFKKEKGNKIQDHFLFYMTCIKVYLKYFLIQ